MGVLEKINHLKKQGVKEDEIFQNLQEQGISPGEIEDAMQQLKVKEAVSAEQNFTAPTPNYQMKKPQNSGQFYTPRTQDIENPETDLSEMQNDYYSPEHQNESQNYPAQNSQQQEYYPQYNYDEYSPQTQTSTNTDTIIEIAEQVFSEKTKTMQKQIDTLTEFANLAENKIENNNERIKRIEKIIDNLQIKILEKVGSYGDSLESTKKEMSMMQESFSKILPELAEAKKHEHKK